MARFGSKGLNWVKKTGGRFLMVIGAANLVVYGYHFRKASFRRESFRKRKLISSSKNKLIVTHNFKPVGEGQFPVFRRKPKITSHFDLLMSLDRVLNDERVQGFVAKMKDVSPSPGLGQIQEISSLIKEISGKKPIFFVGDRTYHPKSFAFLSSFSKTFLSPTGCLWFTPSFVEMLFFKDLLDKFGIGLEVLQTSEFKGAGNPFSQSGFTTAQANDVKRILRDLREEITPERYSGSLLKILNNGPYNAERALEEKLIDGISYFDQVVDMMKDTLDAPDGPPPTVVTLAEYKAFFSPKPVGKDQCALVTIDGILNDHMGHKILTGLDQCQENPLVKTVVIRINSPGGEVNITDEIHRAVVRLRESGKVVIASVGNISASGGYYIAAGCDEILANSGSIVGSIGVLLMRPKALEILDKIGVKREKVRMEDTDSSLESLDSVFEKDDPKAGTILKDYLSYTQKLFVRKVEEGRGEKVDSKEVATGQIWLGGRCPNGLLDQLGGLREAIKKAKEKAEIHPNAPVVQYPRLSLKDIISTFFERLFPIPRLQMSLQSLFLSLPLFFQETSPFVLVQADKST